MGKSVEGGSAEERAGRRLLGSRWIRVVRSDSSPALMSQGGWTGTREQDLARRSTSRGGQHQGFSHAAKRQRPVLTTAARRRRRQLRREGGGAASARGSEADGGGRNTRYDEVQELYRAVGCSLLAPPPPTPTQQRPSASGQRCSQPTHPKTPPAPALVPNAILFISRRQAKGELALLARPHLETVQAGRPGWGWLFVVPYT